MRIRVAHIVHTTMQNIFDLNAPKKATNVGINSGLLMQAKSLKINLSAALEQTLAQFVEQKQKELWLAQNKAAIDAYNELVEEHGVFSDSTREF